MISKTLLIKCIMNAFILWHLTTILFAPLTNGYLVTRIDKIVREYKNTFNLFHGFGYFAPFPKMNGLIYYIVTDKNNQEHLFQPVPELKREDPNYYKKMRIYDYIAYNLKISAQGFSTYACKAHKDLSPHQIHIFSRFQERIPPESYSDNINLMEKTLPGEDYIYVCGEQ